MCKVSCDICKFSSPHDYVPNHYYCNKGLFFNDRESRGNCEDGEINDWKYKDKYGISYTMSQFKETVSKINELRNNEKKLSRKEIMSLWNTTPLFIDWGNGSDSLLQENGYTLRETLNYEAEGYSIYRD